MTAILLAAASAQTTELQLGTTLALSSATCLQHPRAPLHRTLSANQVSSHLNSALQLALQQILSNQFWAQQPVGAQAGAEATAVWPGCT